MDSMLHILPVSLPVSGKLGRQYIKFLKLVDWSFQLIGGVEKT